MNAAMIGRKRLLSQRIDGEKFETPEEVVRWMGAMQAQDYGQALWAVGSRMQSPRIAAVEQAIADGKIVLTWPMRGTIHMVAPEDAKWLVALSESRMLGRLKKRYQELGLDEATLARASAVFSGALQGGAVLTRSAMIDLLSQAGIDPGNQRGNHLLGYFSQTGLICFGPKQNKEQTFVLLDAWVPQARTLSRHDSLAELANRYICSRGPATIKDFAGWAGITLADAKLGLWAAPKLVTERFGNKEFWMSQETSAYETTPSGVHLLASFDEFLLGYKNRDDVLDPRFADKVGPGKNGMFFATIVVDGRVIGTWKRTIKTRAVHIALDPFEETFGAHEKAVLEAVAQYGQFLGLPVIL